MSQPAPYIQGQFQPGNPTTYVATRTFDLGATNLKAIEGMLLQFDGSVITMAGHPPISMPQLRGAIKIGWLVPEAEYNPLDQSSKIPRPAGMQMRPAEGGNPLDPKPRQDVNTAQVDHEEREVANVRQHAEQVQQRNLNREYRTGRENTSVRMGDPNYVIEEQDGVVVRGLQTPAKQDTNVMNAGRAISQANAVKVAAGVAPSREDVMAAMTPQQQHQYVSELASRRAVHDPEGAVQMMESAARVVATVQAPQNVQSTGINVQTTVGGGTEIADMGGTGGAGPAQMSVIEEGGMKFTTTNGPRKNVRMVPRNPPQTAAAPPAPPVDDALCRKIAKAICPDFPDNYVFTDSTRKKVARLQADYDDRPDIIRAVAAAESDMAVRSRLVNEFPEAFA